MSADRNARTANTRASQLAAAEKGAAEFSSPNLSPVRYLELHVNRDIGAGSRKAEDGADEARQ
jgi:hypothetical protein